MSQTLAGNPPAFSPAVPTATVIPKQKVIAAAGGSGVATALAVLVLYALQSAGFNPPADVKDAVTTVFVAFITFLAGYVCPPGAAEGSVRDATGAIRSAIVPSV